MLGSQLKPARPGEVITAERWNALLRRLNMEVTGPNVLRTVAGWHIRDRRVQGGGEIDAKLAKVYQLGVYPEPYLRVHAVNHLYEPVGEYFDVGVFTYNFIDWDHTQVPLEADYLVPIVKYGFTEGPGGAWYLGFPIVGVCDPPVSV